LPWSSQSDDAGTHGHKQFFLYASNSEKYVTDSESSKNLANQLLVSRTQNPTPTLRSKGIEQILVKESFLPAKDASTLPVPQDLFMMVQFAKDTPHTDDGWVFAVVTPDHKTVKEFGRIESCMSCHDAAPHGHLFGLSALP
jgi:hypothetical protein